MKNSRLRANAAVTRRHLPACIAALLATGAPAFGGVPDLGTAPSTTNSTLVAMPPAKLAAHAEARPAYDSTFGAALTAPPDAPLSGNTLVVTSCGDNGGFDTLRHAVLVANTGDTVDLSGLACSVITLQAGAIAIGLSDLTIVGPGKGKLTIDGDGMDRVFSHTGIGTLTLNDVTIAHGTFAAAKAYGGCIYSKSSVSLNHSEVTACVAQGQTVGAGGGIAALDTVTVRESAITDCLATATAAVPKDVSALAGGVLAVKKLFLVQSLLSGNIAQASTGAVYAGGALTGDMTVKYSTVTENIAASAGEAGNYGAAGALMGSTLMKIFASTIDHNSADIVGAVLIQEYDASTALITMSTISSNVGTVGLGAISAEGKVSILGSTIAFNTSGPTVPVNSAFSKAANLQNTIMADNAPADLASALPVTGSNNLLKVLYPATVVPLDTIVLDPNLLPLAFNGGPTRTHALGAGSPAIDTGSTSYVYDVDQRGPTYPRVAGAASDIGAVEVDTDHIFGTSLDFPLSL